MPHLQKVIISEIQRGQGKLHDPVRLITQVHDCEGALLAEFDSLSPNYDIADGKWILKAWHLTKPQK